MTPSPHIPGPAQPPCSEGPCPTMGVPVPVPEAPLSPQRPGLSSPRLTHCDATASCHRAPQPRGGGRGLEQGPGWGQGWWTPSRARAGDGTTLGPHLSQGDDSILAPHPGTCNLWTPPGPALCGGTHPDPRAEQGAHHGLAGRVGGPVLGRHPPPTPSMAVPPHQHPCPPCPPPPWVAHLLFCWV